MSVAIAIVAFACLALAMNRHHADRFGSPAPLRRVRVLRAVGSVCIAALLAWDMTRDGAAVGALYAVGHAGIGAGVTLLALTYLPRRHASTRRRR